MTEELVQQFLASWPAPVVARNEVHVFSGGLVSPKTLANADAAHCGPHGALRFGKRRVAYPTQALALWIAEKCFQKQ